MVEGFIDTKTLISQIYTNIGGYIMEQYITDAIENMENEEQAFYDITDKATYKNYKVGYENLTEGENKLSGVGILIAEVNNGGFDQYFIHKKQF